MTGPTDAPSSDDLRRRRPAALAAKGATIALGLASRRWPSALPASLGQYPGDAPRASMVFFGWRALRPRAHAREAAWTAMTTCLAVESAKLWQATWLVEFRGAMLGHLLPGRVFSWQNRVAYASGVLAGAVLDRRLSGATR